MLVEEYQDWCRVQHKTDYEAIAPPGIVRDYTLVLSNKTINADGIPFPYGKVFSEDCPEGEEFDGTFPGPLIQACWGDVSTISDGSPVSRSDMIVVT